MTYRTTTVCENCEATKAELARLKARKACRFPRWTRIALGVSIAGIILSVSWLIVYREPRGKLVRPEHPIVGRCHMGTDDGKPVLYDPKGYRIPLASVDDGIDLARNKIRCALWSDEETD